MRLPRRATLAITVSALAASSTLTLAGPASAADPTTWDTLVSAFATGGPVRLGADITAPAGAFLVVGGDVHFDLNGHDLTINDDVAYEEAAIQVPEGRTLSIDDSATGGELVVVGGDDSGAGIGADYSAEVGDIEIRGGIIEATGGKYAAGIGSSYFSESAGTVTISGGTVTATAGDGGAGIGGGAGGDGATVDIGAGATVTVSGPRALGHGVTGSAWGTLNNAGTLEITAGSELTVPTGVTVANSGRIIGDGTVTVDTGGGISGHHYELGFDNTAGIGGPYPSLTVYAASVADAGKSLPAPAAPAGTAFTGWFRASTAVRGDTDLGTALGDATGAAISATLTSSFLAPHGVTAWERLVELVAGGVDDITLGDDIVAPAGGSLLVPAPESSGIDLAGHRLAITAPSSGQPAIGVPAGAAFTLADSGIDGALVALGGSNAAGIGGGDHTDAGEITLGGGAVTAIGGSAQAAGIGGGAGGAGGDVEVTEGVVAASGSSFAAAIGGGYQGAGGAIVIGHDADLTLRGAIAAGRGASSPGGWGSMSNAGTLRIPTGSILTVPTGVTVVNTGRIIGSGTVTVQTGGAISRHSYVLTFEATGSGPAYSPIAAYAGSLADAEQTLPTPSLPGRYRFAGWYTAPAGGDLVTDATDLEAVLGSGPQAVTLYAHVATSPTVLTFALDQQTAVYGQELTTSVTVSDNGYVRFYVDDAPLGDPVLSTSGRATSPVLVDPVSGDPLEPGAHTVRAVLDPLEQGLRGSSGHATATVIQGATTAEAAITADALTATVAALSPGVGTPTGTITFSVDGTALGTADLIDGVATLDHTLPTATGHQVTATYAGDDHFTGSTATTTRTNPRLRTSITGTRDQHGHFTGRVTIRFRCAPGTAPLTRPCPRPVRIRPHPTRTVKRTVTATITATDGGTATVRRTIKIHHH